MWISKKRLELEKRVAVEDVLAQIIKESKQGQKFQYTINLHSPFGNEKTVYNIKATPIKKMSKGL